MVNRFVETTEYRRFAEFCDACSEHQWIGVCHGAPGVGKTLSARHYAHWDALLPWLHPRHAIQEPDLPPCHVAFFTASAVMANAPARIDRAIDELRESLARLRQRAMERPAYTAASVQSRDMSGTSRDADGVPVIWRSAGGQLAITHPISLLIVDEVDLLKMPAVEQLRAIYDRGGIGMVLIGMPGLEKRLARYPQLFSRIGWVHEFRPLTNADVRQLLADGWLPAGVSLPAESLDDEDAVAMLIRITQGKFRLLHRLLTQIHRVLEVNGLDRVTVPVVEAARESLVIGTA